MAKAATVITPSTVVRGRLEGAEDLDIQGRLEGQIELEGAVTIETSARVDGTVKATSILVHGIMIGDGTASDTIHLTGDALVVGDLNAPRIIIDDGAKIRGLVDMGGPGSAAPKRARATQPSRAKAAPTADTDTVEEPELPGGASSKKVNVKKRQ
jgi:cytoskeletal protein CcmA (bactofilin family)